MEATESVLPGGGVGQLRDLQGRGVACKYCMPGKKKTHGLCYLPDSRRLVHHAETDIHWLAIHTTPKNTPADYHLPFAEV